MFKNLTKTDKLIFSFAVVCLGLSSFFLYDDSLLFSLTGGSKRASIGVVQETERDVRYKSIDQIVWTQANLQEKVHQGDSIFTGPNSKTTIVLEDGSKLTLAENSYVAFNFQGSDLQLDLKFGRVQSQLSQNTKLKVNLGCDPVEVSGAQAVVDIGADCTVNTISGQAKVVSKKGLVKKDVPKTMQKRKVASTEFTVEKPQPKSAPTPVIITPTTQEVLTFKAQQEPFVQFSWESTLDKVKFEVQVSTDANFAVEPKNFIVTRRELLSKDFGPGSYFVRARSLEGSGYLQSEWSQSVPFKIDQLKPLLLKAPVLITRQLDTNTGERPTAEWAPTEGAKSFVIETSPNSDFSKVLDAANSEQVKIKLPANKAGRTYFRVRAVGEDNVESENSDVGVLNVKTTRPILNPIEEKWATATSPEDKGPTMEFPVTWSESPGASSYQIEWATDKDFTSPTKSESRNTASLVTVPQSGEYFVRVRAQGPRGEAVSDFSDPGTISYRLKSALATPLLALPQNNITLFFQKKTAPYLWLTWETVKDAKGYVLELSTDADFAKIVTTKKLTDTKFQLTNQYPAGAIYWRVQALGENDNISSWSEVRSLNFASGRGVANSPE